MNSGRLIALGRIDTTLPKVGARHGGAAPLPKHLKEVFDEIERGDVLDCAFLSSEDLGEFEKIGREVVTDLRDRCNALLLISAQEERDIVQAVSGLVRFLWSLRTTQPAMQAYRPIGRLSIVAYVDGIAMRARLEAAAGATSRR